MGEMVRVIKGLKDGKHRVETEFQQKYGHMWEPICLGSSKYERKTMYHKAGRMPTYSPSTKQ